MKRIDLQGADALLAGEHQVNDAEPVAKRLVRVLKDGPDRDARTDSRSVAHFSHCQCQLRDGKS